MPAIVEDDDRELVALVRAGAAGAFTRLVERHQPRVFGLARGILGDWQQSEDVCQEVFMTVYRKLSTFRGEARFSTWLYRITVHAALKARRRLRRWNPRPLEAAAAVAASEDGRRAFEDDEAVRRLLRPLPEKLRVVVLLRDVAGLTYDEISTVLGCTRGAVEQRIHRAMTILREVWTDEGL